MINKLLGLIKREDYNKENKVKKFFKKTLNFLSSIVNYAIVTVLWTLKIPLYITGQTNSEIEFTVNHIIKDYLKNTKDEYGHYYTLKSFIKEGSKLLYSLNLSKTSMWSEDGDEGIPTYPSTENRDAIDSMAEFSVIIERSDAHIYYAVAEDFGIKLKYKEPTIQEELDHDEIVKGLRGLGCKRLGLYISPLLEYEMNPYNVMAFMVEDKIMIVATCHSVWMDSEDYKDVVEPFRREHKFSLLLDSNDYTLLDSRVRSDYDDFETFDREEYELKNNIIDR